MLPTAKVDGKTRAYVRDGVTMHAGSLTVLAYDPNEVDPVVYTATATSKVFGIGAVSGAGVKADAQVTGSVEAFVGAPAGKAAGGAFGAALHISGGGAPGEAPAQKERNPAPGGPGARPVTAQTQAPTADPPRRDRG